MENNETCILCGYSLDEYSKYACNTCKKEISPNLLLIITHQIKTFNARLAAIEEKMGLVDQHEQWLQVQSKLMEEIIKRR